MSRRPNNIGDSPLLAGERPLSASSFTSTVKSEEFEPRRLTERQMLEEDNNTVRIIIYVVIVILVGVGTALLLKTLIAKNEESENDQTQEQVQQTTTTSGIKVNSVVLADSTAKNVAQNTDYVDSAILTLGDANLDLSKVSLDSIEISKYASFSRMNFDFTGTSTNVPKVNINFDSIKKQLTVAFPTGLTIADSLKIDKTVGDLIKEVRFDTINSKFIIVLSEDAKYRVFQDSGDLNIDFKTLTELAKPEVTQTTTTETQTQEEQQTAEEETTTTTGSKPAAPHYDNGFSQEQQYVSSSVTGNTVAQNKYYYYDAGEHFEFSWGHTGEKGDAYTPNATAYYKLENGKNYIYVEIENLSQEIFMSNGITGTDLSGKIDTSASNFVRVDVLKFENGKATYRVEVKKKTDFSLIAEPAFGEVGQLITLKMKD